MLMSGSHCLPLIRVINRPKLRGVYFLLKRVVLKREEYSGSLKTTKISYLLNCELKLENWRKGGSSMKSFGKTLTHGSDYSSVWPSQPELAPIFPEQRVIYLLNWGKRIIPALIVLSGCLQLQWGNAAHWPTFIASCLFALSLPVQGYYWLGRRADTQLPPSLSRWYFDINQKMNCAPSVNRPSYFDLATTLRKAFEQLDRVFLFQ